jgi:predicted nucleotidyltransferase
MTKNIGHPGWEGLFASPTLARLLARFLTHPDTAFYQRELLGAARAQLYAVQQALGRLERTGIVTKRPGGNRVYYQANRAHPAFEDLRRVVLKTVGLGDALRAALAPVADRIRVAAIYGSLARGEDTLESDIDLLLIGSLSLRETAALLSPVGRRVGREFNVTAYPPEEFRQKARSKHHFVSELLVSEKIFLMGSADVLAELVD